MRRLSSVMVIAVVAASVLLVTAIGSFAMMHSGDLLRERIRLLRGEHQRLEQQLQILQLPDYENLFPLLDNTLADLQIELVELVELLTREAPGDDVLSLSFEQSILTHQLEINGSYPVSTLRLTLSANMGHADVLLRLFHRIDQHVIVWPREVRACRIFRQPPKALRVSCILDFYHWSDNGSVSAQSLMKNIKELRT